MEFVEMPLEMKKKIVNAGVGGKKLTDDPLRDVY